ncbi:MAG: flagellar motor switch protein FliN, partial [Hyphomicrobiales bacterium]
MSTNNTGKDVPLPNLAAGDIDLLDEGPVAAYPDEGQQRIAQDLEKVFDVPVKVSAV